MKYELLVEQSLFHSERAKFRTYPVATLGQEVQKLKPDIFSRRNRSPVARLLKRFAIVKYNVIVKLYPELRPVIHRKLRAEVLYAEDDEANRLALAVPEFYFFLYYVVAPRQQRTCLPWRRGDTKKRL